MKNIFNKAWPLCFLIPCLFFFVCIKSSVCIVLNMVVDGVSTALAQDLNCGNPQAVKASIKGFADKISMCSALPTVMADHKVNGVIGSAVCVALAKFGVSELGNFVPSAWNCAPLSSMPDLSILIESACSFVPF